LNTIWYQDIADHAYISRGRRRRSVDFSFQGWLSAMADELYRVLLIGSFMIQMSLVSLIPYIGNVLSLMHICWIYSLYSFEYKWILEGWNLETRLHYFESRWAYFAGFGFPSALLTLMFPKFISAGIFAFIFPIFIILAIEARPVSHSPPLESVSESEPSKENENPNSGGESLSRITAKEAKISSETKKSGRENSSAGTTVLRVEAYRMPIFKCSRWFSFQIASCLRNRNR